MKLDDAQSYCRSRAAAPGTDLYYALRDAAPAHRLCLESLYALHDELLGFGGSHPEVADARLRWWEEELDCLRRQRPRHPAAIALLAQTEAHAAEYALAGIDEAIQQWWDAAAARLRYNSHTQFSSLLQQCHLGGSSLAIVHSRIIGCSEPDSIAFAHEIGVAMMLGRLLADLRDEVGRGHFWLPEDELDRFGVSHEDLLQVRHNESLRRLIGYQIARIRDFWRRALSHLTADSSYVQRSQLIQGELLMRWLQEVEADGCAVLQRRLELTPLRKLWLAWRITQRTRKRRYSMTQV